VKLVAFGLSRPASQTDPLPARGARLKNRHRLRVAHLSEVLPPVAFAPVVRMTALRAAGPALHPSILLRCRGAALLRRAACLSGFLSGPIVGDRVRLSRLRADDGGT
jgi:hypothetical protein